MPRPNRFRIHKIEIGQPFWHILGEKGNGLKMRYDILLDKVVFTREYTDGNAMYRDCMEEMDALFSDLL